MFESFKKDWMTLGLLRAHLCTAAVSVGLQTTWRVPRDAFRYGGLQYGLVLTVAMLGVALPLALLQLAVGQLSQQDAVGIWRAVPFFRGIGYLRLLISFLGAIYSVIYVTLTICYFLYTISNNSLPFAECTDFLYISDDNSTDVMNLINASSCLNMTFLAPVTEKPSYYLAVALISITVWIVLPFLFYNTVKYMKRILYVVGPAVIILVIVIASCIGNSGNLSNFVSIADWGSFVDANIWHGAIVQALLSSQIAGGFLISSGDTLYSNTNVQWTAVAFVVANIVSSWVSLLFWYCISGGHKETSVLAVLLQTYTIGEETDLQLVWPLIILFTLFLSGLISLLTLLFPIFERLRRAAGLRWRAVAAAASLGGASVSLATLAVREPALTLMDDYAVPLLVTITTIVEISTFILVYGWKVLVEDIEFLTGGEISKCWVVGWCAAPGIIAPFSAWWLAHIFLHDHDWTQPPWPAATVISTSILSTIVFFICASVVVAKQVQYDILGKLKSSFKPSRHWGPRDPITHYYWLARRDEIENGNVPTSRYQRRPIGQFLGRPSILNPKKLHPEKTSVVDKYRSNSDDLVYTVQRKQARSKERAAEGRARANSLDWALSMMKDKADLPGLSFTYLRKSKESDVDKIKNDS